MPTPPLLQAWQSYYSLLATAAATLAGLLFVGLTFSVGAIKKDVEQVVRIWGEPPLYDFIQVLAIGCLAEFPDLTATALGWSLLAWSVWRVTRWWEVVVYLRGLGAKSDLELSDWLERVVYPGLLYLGLVVAALGFLTGQSWAPLALAIDSLGVLLLGIYATWTQLVWMADQKSPEKRKKRE